MKIVAPTRLLAEAADVLEPVRDDVVVAGAAALEVALAGVSDALAQLVAGGDATAAAARQMVRLRTAGTQREAEAVVRRAAIRFERRLAAA